LAHRIDWANVYGWQKSLKIRIDVDGIYKYLRQYKLIYDIHFYFGSDNNAKSQQFLKDVSKIGYTLHTKPVKHIRINSQPPIFKRKCDFDLEIAMQVMMGLKKFKTFIFFSGDGDFAPLYELLLKEGKQVLVVYAHQHLGREVWKMKRVVYLLDIKKISPAEAG